MRHQPGLNPYKGKYLYQTTNELNFQIALANEEK
jgi:hypothetical protein